MAHTTKELGTEFEDRSDYLRDEELISWNVENDFFKNIQKELLGTGNRLLVGPRGTGKTHQMKIAYLSCVKGNKTKPFAIFVSLNKYFHLEPLLTRSVNALQLFHAWVLTKVVLGAVDFAREVSPNISTNFSEFNQEWEGLTIDQLQNFQNKVESPYEMDGNNYVLSDKINLSSVLAFVEKITRQCQRKRTIILLDDAALTLTPEYFVEFLDIFRSLKTHYVAPKASVYPGTTQYSPKFQVGHDAQLVHCWMSVEHERYVEFMKSLIDKRFSSNIEGIGPEMLEILIYGAFGVPRTLIGLLRGFQEANATERNPQARYNRARDQRIQLIEMEYMALRAKVPQYSDIISVGWKFFTSLVSALGVANRVSDADGENSVSLPSLFGEIAVDQLSKSNSLDFEKQIQVGIEEENDKMHNKMLGFLNEAGLLYSIDSHVKHGPNREYKRFIPHILFLLKERTFSSGHGFSAHYTLLRLKAKQKKQPLRRSFATILTEEDLHRLKLNMPPCQHCSTPRLTEGQKFCHSCGNRLINKSAFDHCMEMKIQDLPLTEWQKDRLRTIQIVTVGDFMLLSNPGGELRRVKGFGPKRSELVSKKIQNEAKEIIEKALVDFMS